MLAFPLFCSAQWSANNYSIYSNSSRNIGIGTITPIAKLDIFNTSNLLYMKMHGGLSKYSDSSVYFLTNGRVILGDSSIIKIGVNAPVSDAKLTIVGGVPFRLLNSNSVGYSSIKFSSKTASDTIADYAQVTGGVSSNIYGAHKGLLSLGTYGLNPYGVNYMNTWMILDHKGYVFFGDSSTTTLTTIKPGYIGLGKKEPTSFVDISGNGGSVNLLKASNDIDANIDSTMIISSKGHIGVGTTNPLYPITIIDTIDTYGIYSYTTKSNAAIYGEYNGANNNSAISGVASGSYGHAISGMAFGGGIGGRFTSATGYSLVTIGDIVNDTVREHHRGTVLSDHEKYTFPINKTWVGTIDVDSLGFTLFTANVRCDADGTPYLESTSWKRWSSITYAAVGASDGYLNLSDDGSGFAITNELGYSINCIFTLRAKE